MSIKSLKSAKVIFWDFDGVIKDSVKVKTDAFEKLFSTYGNDIVKKIRIHHEENGGVSRFDKIPNYLKWVKQELSQEIVNRYSNQFSILVKKNVIDSEWVVGVLNFLQNNHLSKKFFIVTATPQKEIEDILSQLKIDIFFQSVIGSPTKKGEAIKMILDNYSILPEDSVMIGDSESDYNAAIVNMVPFILRKTEFNKKLQDKINCQMIKDFNE